MPSPRWSAYIEFATTNVPDDVHDRIVDLLAPHNGAPTTAPNGNFGIQVTVETPTAEQAVTTALDLTSTALRTTYGSSAVAVIEVMSEEEQTRRLASPEIPKLIGRMGVVKVLDVSPARADQIMKSKQWQEHVQPATVIDDRPVFPVEMVKFFASQVRAPGVSGPRPKTVKEAKADKAVKA